MCHRTSLNVTLSRIYHSRLSFPLKNIQPQTFIFPLLSHVFVSFIFSLLAKLQKPPKDYYFSSPAISLGEGEVAHWLNGLMGNKMCWSEHSLTRFVSEIWHRTRVNMSGQFQGHSQDKRVRVHVGVPSEDGYRRHREAAGGQDQDSEG